MRKIFLTLTIAAFFLLVPFQAGAVMELLDGDIRIDGYMRMQSQFFTQEDAHDDYWADARGTLQLEGQFRFSEEMLLMVIYRGVRHALGDEADEAGVPSDYFDDSDIREIYVEINKPCWYLRAGRQQIIWGETDFFRLADIINPIDFGWRAFWEDWQDIRIPNYMIDFTYHVSDLGSMEFVWRPGLDSDVVDQFAPAGAPWAVRPAPGGPPPYNVVVDGFGGSEYPGKGLNNGSFGFRWIGDFSLMGVFANYTLSYFYGWQEAPVAEFDGFDVPSNTAFLTLNWPRLNVWGGTMTFPVQALESIVRVEGTFQRNRYYNFDSAKSSLTDPKGTESKDVIKYAVGWDWTPHYWWTKWGSRQAWMYSVQIFQSITLDWTEDEELVKFGGYPGSLHEFETIITAYGAGHYNFDRIQPMWAIGYDAHGMWMYLAKCTFAYGDHWRWVIEWDAFDAGGMQKYVADMGLLAEQDILQLKVTYHF